MNAQKYYKVYTAGGDYVARFTLPEINLLLCPGVKLEKIQDFIEYNKSQLNGFYMIKEK